MTRFAAFIATSLDGFIADAEGRIDWLERANALVPPGEDCGYAAFFASVDALVVGRKTFEQVLRFPQWPWGEKPVVVLSRTLSSAKGTLPRTVRVMEGEPAAIAAELSRAGHRRAYLDGGLTISRFLDAGLLDEITLTTIPVRLGRGLPLFHPAEKSAEMELVSSKSWPFGFVQNRWRPRKPAAEN